MEKHLNKIVIAGVIIILVFLGLIVATIINDNKPVDVQVPTATNNVPAETAYNTEDYVISQSVQIHTDPNAELGDMHSRVLGLVESFNVENEQVTGFNIKDIAGNAYVLSVADMKLTSLDYNGESEVNLAFKTGGSARAVVGSYIYLYKADDSTWSLDERVHHGGSIEKASGTVTGFEFAPMIHQNGHILLSYILLDINGQTAKLPMTALKTQSVMSNGTMTVYYVGDATNDNIYNVRAENDFAMHVTMQDGSTATYQIGTQINVQKSSKKGYWEPQQNIDTSRKRAVVTDIIFSYDEKNVTGINYIVLQLDDGSTDYMTLLETKASYGEPSGNYKRIYTAQGNDMVISDVEPHEDFMMKMYYQNGVVIRIYVGAEVWITKNADDVYTIDDDYTFAIQQS